MTTRIITLLILLSFSIPVYAAGLEVIKTDEASIRYEAGLSGVSHEIARLIPSLKNEIQERTGLPFNFSFEVVIYRDRDTFGKLVNSDMIAAFAIPERNLIVFDYSQFRYDPIALKMIVMHEMCHLLLHKYIAGNNLPRWFDEGVSQWVSGGINEIVYPQSTDVLKRSFISSTVLPFSEISETLPSDRVNLILSYEQSRSMVDYIDKRYGTDSIKKIILELRNGSSFHDAISHASGTDFSEIEIRWKRDKGEQYTWIAYLSSHLYITLFFIAALLTIFGFIGLRKRMRDYHDEEE